MIQINQDRRQVIQKCSHLQLWIRDNKYAKPLYLIINRINGYIEESNANTYLTLISTDGSKDTIKKYEELWSKIRNLIRLIANNSNIYDEKYMKIKFN